MKKVDGPILAEDCNRYFAYFDLLGVRKLMGPTVTDYGPVFRGILASVNFARQEAEKFKILIELNDHSKDFAVKETDFSVSCVADSIILANLKTVRDKEPDVMRELMEVTWFQLLMASVFRYLCAVGIPSRGVLCRGPLWLHRQGDDSVVLGAGLLAAHKAESSLQFVGVAADWSAFSLASQRLLELRGLDDTLAEVGAKLEREHKDRLAPISFLRSGELLLKTDGRPYADLDAVEALAVRFLLDASQRCQSNKDFCSREAAKYYATLKHIESQIPAERLKYLLDLSAKLEQGGEDLSKIGLALISMRKRIWEC